MAAPFPVDEENGAGFIANGREYYAYGTYPRKAWRSAFTGDVTGNHVNSNAIFGNHKHLHSPGYVSDSGVVRGILRNKHEFVPINNNNNGKNTVLNLLDESLDAQDVTGSSGGGSERAKEKRSRLKKLSRVMDAYIRPTAAEFISLFFSVFIVTLIESSMVKSGNSRIAQNMIISAAEGICYTVFLLIFQDPRIHLNPLVTLGTLFAGGIKPLLCILYWLAQLTAATLAVVVYQIVTVDGPPILPEILTGRNGEEWLVGVYRIVLSQTVTSAIVVMSHLKVFSNHDSDQIYQHQSAIAVSCAAMLGSFVSLLSSTTSWNPVRTLGTSIAATLGSTSVPSWKYHYVFWLGPTLGSLFASFFYRLIFADDGRRLGTCTAKDDDSENN